MSSHCADKTVLWLSYFHNGISYTGKMTDPMLGADSRFWLANNHEI